MDELVKRLRNCVDSLCGECKYQQLQKPGNFVPCMNAMITEAADAIEELTGFVQEAERDRDEYRERLDKANDAIEELSAAEKKYLANISALETENQHLKRERYWIPVTERLPEEVRKSYLCRTDSGYHCEVRWTDNVYGLWTGGGGQWGWSIFDIPQYAKVTHWMPLPSTEGLNET